MSNCEKCKELESAVEQMCADLNQAHDEILRAQGCEPEDFDKHDWPEWTPQANSIRWAERMLGKRLAKTSMWSTFPDKQDV